MLIIVKNKIIFFIKHYKIIKYQKTSFENFKNNEIIYIWTKKI